MATKTIGKVTDSERQEILKLHSRRVSLEQITTNYLSNNGHVSDHPEIVEEIGDLAIKVDSWWKRKARDYNWESAAAGSWSIDFETGDIILSY